ncbi:MAG: cytochrome b N-terminal domain-containing protein [Deltaproteobacteria bacterium]|nr:cytochrome b N-terminal domain-containing protein [Deltaproteobacteria bacterium]
MTIDLFDYLRTSPTPQEKKKFLLKNLILHFRPVTVPEKTLKFTLSWGLGGTAAVLVMLLIGTGLLLKFVYQPFPDKAYESILMLQDQMFFGVFIRNIHHWSANLLVVIVFLHFLRVFFTGAFLQPRQFNWIIGLCLFLAVLAANFTGYLLPWDQLSYWAVTICTGVLEYIPGAGTWLQEIIRGGSEIGPSSLRIFFALHTAILPITLFVLMAFHFWRVRRAGGLVVPRSPGEYASAQVQRVSTLTNLMPRELVVALAVVAFIFLFSVFFEAPLGDRANPGLSPNPTKAPWYFMGFQETLLHFHPLIAVLVIPVIMVCALVSIPYIRYPAGSGGVWFVSAKGRRLALGAAVAALIFTPTGIVLDEYLLNFGSWMPGVPPVISSGLVPLVILLSLWWLLHRALKRRYSPDRNETIQMVFVFFLTAFVILTITGIAFRGPGMGLVWPWGE